MTEQDIPHSGAFAARVFPPAWQIAVQAVALYIVIVVLLGILVSAEPGFIGNDDYYHARMGSEIIEQRRLAVDFPWLPETILSPDKFVDHHLLYHLYIGPWVHVGGIAGARLGQIAIVAAAFLTAWMLLRQIGVRHPALWSLALFGLSSPFLYRMLMIRTQGASLLLLFLSLIVLFQRRYRWLVLLSFAYAWLYNGFILLPAVAIAYVAAVWLADRRLDLRPVVFSVFGIALGIVINPYFPRNIVFLIEHLGAKVDFESGVRVGSEWYPYTTGALLANSAGALLSLGIGLLRPSIGSGRRDRIETTLLLVSLLTLLMLFRSRRFIEYFPPFALLFCAAAWGRYRDRGFDLRARRLAAFVSIAAFVVGALFVVTTFMDTRRLIEDSESPQQFVGASNWLKANTPEGSLVFQLDWDDFTRLFYHNTWNTYLVGLDPTYLERADPRRWELWVAITRGEVEQPSQVIKDQFGAHFVVGDRRHEAFEDQAADDADMMVVYWDADSILWEISD